MYNTSCTINNLVNDMWMIASVVVVREMCFFGLIDMYILFLYRLVSKYSYALHENLVTKYTSLMSYKFGLASISRSETPSLSAPLRVPASIHFSSNRQPCAQIQYPSYLTLSAMDSLVCPFYKRMELHWLVQYDSNKPPGT